MTKQEYLQRENQILWTPRSEGGQGQMAAELKALKEEFEKANTPKKVFSFDAETDGLWGKPIAIAAIVYESGVETARFLARMPDDTITDDWVKKNVLPTLEHVPVTHTNYETMISDFANFYMQHKKDADVICHMGYIVEAHLLREMHRLGAIGDWDAPYPLYDISGNLQAAGEDSTSVDAYAKKHNLNVNDFGSTHNPLHDCEVAARVYIHLTQLQNQ